VSPVEDEQGTMSEAERRRRRVRDIWQLDIPLVVALGICVSATVIEFQRAGTGNWRAGIYMVEWPLIGAFCIWIWFRFRREGGSFRGMTRRWRERVARYEEEAAREAAESRVPPGVDPELDAWREYTASIREKDPPGAPE
jgi:hypothetical protein